MAVRKLGRKFRYIVTIKGGESWYAAADDAGGDLSFSSPLLVMMELNSRSVSRYSRPKNGRI